MQHGQLPVLHGGNSACRDAKFVTNESTAYGEGKEDEEENKGRKRAYLFLKFISFGTTMRRKWKAAVAHPRRSSIFSSSTTAFCW